MLDPPVVACLSNADQSTERQLVRLILLVIHIILFSAETWCPSRNFAEVNELEGFVRRQLDRMG